MRTLAAAILLWVSAVTAAQRVPPLQPVDQAVSDLDPLSTSLRWVEPGNAVFSHRVRIHQLRGQPAIDPTTGLALPREYLFRAPGVRARIDRPQYLVLSPFSTPKKPRLDQNVSPALDGGLIEVIGPNTIFDLVPRPIITTSTHGLDRPAARIDARLDTRINSRLHTAIGKPLGPWSPATTTMPRWLNRIGSSDLSVPTSSAPYKATETNLTEPQPPDTPKPLKKNRRRHTRSHPLGR